MNQEEINKQLFERLERLEKAVFTTEKKEIKKETVKRAKNIDLNAPILKLHSSGFFKKGRTDIEVCEELHLKLLTPKKPLRSSVVNVLRSMVKKGLLVRENITRGKRTILIYKEPDA
jgi:hypothetical protein